MGYLCPENEWEFNHLLPSLEGKTFLDVGSNDGYFCFEAERRGASQTVATDIYHSGENSNRDGWNVNGITMAREYLGSKVNIQSLSIYELAQLNQQFDVVLCSNVISWLTNINDALESLASVCANELYIKEGFLTYHEPDPVLMFVRQWNNNKGKFIPNISYTREVLKLHGFKTFEVHPLNVYDYYDWQLTSFPAVAEPNSAAFFQSPLDTEPAGNAEIKGKWVLSEYGDCYFIRNVGWVRKHLVRTTPRKTTNWKGRILKAVTSEWSLNEYYRKKGPEPHVRSCMMIARR